MSVLTDFILGTNADADYLTTGESITRFDRVEITDFDAILVGLLFALSTKQNEDGFWTDFDASEVVYSEDGPWLYRIPKLLISALSPLSASEIAAIAEQIVKDENCEGCNLDTLRSFLTNLVALCQKAIQQANSVLYYRVTL